MAAVRSRKKAALQSQARYDAAGAGRRIKSWTPPSSGPQRAVEGLQKIRDRARDTTRNDWAGESGVQKWTTALVGVGITPRWKNAAHKGIWTRWSPQADADNVLDIYGLQALMTRSWASAGEVFIRRRPRDLSLPLEVPVQVQLIEADFVPLFDSDTWNGLPAGNTIRQGIERNRFGRRTAYWVYKEHPGDKPASNRPGATDLIRVPASEMAHVFEPSRPGALRGVSMMAPILVKLRGSMDFEDAVLDRQKLANLFTMFITRAMPSSWAEIETDPDTGLPKWYDDLGNALVGLEPGISQELKPGEDVKFANPPEAGTSYPDFMRTTHMGTAAGQGMPYELFSGDIRETSDRTLRIMVNEFRRYAEQRQWHVIIHQACRPIVRWVAEAAALAGKIRPSQVEEFATPEWSPHGWPDIHPTQDIEGRIKARDAGFVSTSSIIARSGEDPEAVRAERVADEASGLTPKPPEPAAAPGAKPTMQEPLMAGITALLAVAARPAAAPVAAAGPSAIETALMQMVTAQAAQSDATQRAVLMLAQALADRPLNVAAPAVQVDVQPPAVQVDVAAPAVTVTNEVQPAGVTVTNQVAAPIVNVTNEVQPADVTVDVNLPPREITSDITRDFHGDITKVVQSERTVQ